MDTFPGLRQGSCKRGSGALPPAGTLQWLPGTLCASVQKKILPLRLQPATRWVSAARHLLLPAVREAEAGERQTGDPEAAGYSPSRRVPGAWPRCVGGPPWKVVPGRASRVERRCRTRVRSQHPADTHSLCFGYFSREVRLGRELLLALRAAPAGRSIPSVGALGGGGFPGRVLRPR